MRPMLYGELGIRVVHVGVRGEGVVNTLHAVINYAASSPKVELKCMSMCMCTL